MPKLKSTYPRAVGLVEWAAQQGEAGSAVASFLGRGSGAASTEWMNAQKRADSEEAARRAQSEARSRGRFTRNFIVQSTAAEWALCWMGELRKRLRLAAAQGTDLGQLVFFLHDEIMLHVPIEHAAQVVELVHESARAAAHLLFGTIPVDFPVSAVIVDSYDQAK